MAAEPPVFPKCAGKPEAVDPFFLIREPRQSGTQVSVLDLETGPPLMLVCTVEIWSNFLGQSGEPGRVGTPERVGYVRSVGGQRLQGELTDCVQQKQARIAALLLDPANEAVPDKDSQFVEDRRGGVGDRAYALRRRGGENTAVSPSPSLHLSP